MDLDGFAADVGADGEVSIVGHGTRGSGTTERPTGGMAGGTVGTARVIRAPVGIERIEPDEMVVECGAGTAVTELQAALAEVGQRVCLPGGGTVGGALAVGQSGLRRLGDGPVRNTLLMTRFVNAAGQLVTAGGPTVKNVSGFDLCRLLVGSHGTLGFLGSVVLRTQPKPATSRWFSGSVEPSLALTALYRPTALLWDGDRVWALLEGHPDDVLAQASALGLLADEPPELPRGGRWSLPPGDVLTPSIAMRSGRFVAELGVGIVHHQHQAPRRVVDPEVRRLNDRIKNLFDPRRRLNPGVDVLPDEVGGSTSDGLDAAEEGAIGSESASANR